MVLIGGTLRRASDRYSEALARAEAGERRLRLALDAGRLGTAWFDVLRRTGGWSEAVARMLGLPPDKTEVTYEEWLAIVTPEDRPQAEAALAQALRRGDGYYQAEYRIRRPGGEIRTMEFRGTVSHDSAGRPLRLDGVAGDVTERRRAEEALRESDQRLALATAAADLGIWDWDLVGGRMVYTPRAKAIYGFAPDEAVTHEAVRAATHPDDVAETARLTGRALDPAVRGREPYRFRIRRSDGAVRWILAHGEALFADGPEGPRAVRYLGTIQDVTAQREAELAAEDNASRLRLAIEAGRMAVWDYDAVTGTVRDSPQLFRLLGFAEGERPGVAAMRARYYPGEEERIRTAAAEALARGERHFEVEYRYLWPDGSVRWLLTRAEIRLAEDGSPSGAVGVILDVTDAKHAQEQQNLLIHELNHRVKNTLATVQSIAAQTLRNAASPSAAREGIEGRLMALARAHDVLTRENWEGAELREVVATVVEPYSGRGQDRLRIEGPPVRMTPRMALALAMALQELATNAVKYGALSNQTGRIRIAWGPPSGDAERRLVLSWEESGGPPVAAPTRRGFGTRLIERSLAQDLGAEVAVDYAPGGLVCRVDMPCG